MIFFIIICVLIWIVCGIAAFFIEVKQTKTITFDEEAQREFVFATCFGIISLLIICTVDMRKQFKNFMESLMRKINSK